MGSRKHKRTKAERKIARILRRAKRQQEFLANRLEIEKAFTEIVPQPQDEGDRCWKCGFVLVYRDVKRTKRKPGQAYAYHRYLHCGGCKRNYYFDRDKYWLPGRVVRAAPVPLARDCDRAIASDRTKPRNIVDIARQRAAEEARMTPRLIKAERMKET